MMFICLELIYPKNNFTRHQHYVVELQIELFWLVSHVNFDISILSQILPLQLNLYKPSPHFFIDLRHFINQFFNRNIWKYRHCRTLSQNAKLKLICSFQFSNNLWPILFLTTNLFVNGPNLATLLCQIVPISQWNIWVSTFHVLSQSASLFENKSIFAPKIIIF